MFDHHCFGLVFFIFFHFAIRFWLLSFGFFLRTFSTITSDGSQVCAGSRYRPSRLRSLIQVHGFGRGGKNVRKRVAAYGFPRRREPSAPFIQAFRAPIPAWNETHRPRGATNPA